MSPKCVQLCKTIMTWRRKKCLPQGQVISLPVKLTPWILFIFAIVSEWSLKTFTLSLCVTHSQMWARLRNSFYLIDHDNSNEMPFSRIRYEEIKHPPFALLLTLREGYCHVWKNSMTLTKGQERPEWVGKLWGMYLFQAQPWNEWVPRTLECWTCLRLWARGWIRDFTETQIDDGNVFAPVTILLLVHWLNFKSC